MKHCITCGKSLAGTRRRKYCATHTPNIFADPAPYGTYEGYRGDPTEWRFAFQERFSKAEILLYLGNRTAWEVLGVAANASLEEIKAAYRKRAMETHPDVHPGIDRSLFQAVQAAYQQLEDPNGRDF